MRRARKNGFTLLELLVVLVIVAVMTGLLVMSIHANPARDLEREARGMAALINTAADEAVMRSRELGLALDSDGYHFVVYDPRHQRWQPLDRPPLEAHRFGTGVTVQFRLDGAHIDAATLARIQQFIAGKEADDSRDDTSGQQADRPVLLLLSSGETTPFMLTLRHGAVAWTLRSDGFNPVTARRGEPADSGSGT